MEACIHHRCEVMPCNVGFDAFTEEMLYLFGREGGRGASETFVYCGWIFLSLILLVACNKRAVLFLVAQLHGLHVPVLARNETCVLSFSGEAHAIQPGSTVEAGRRDLAAGCTSPPVTIP